MSGILSPLRQPRVLLGCAATALLHLLVLGWVGAQVAPPARRGERAPLAMSAELLAPPEIRAASTAVRNAQAGARPARRARVRRIPADDLAPPPLAQAMATLPPVDPAQWLASAPLPAQAEPASVPPAQAEPPPVHQEGAAPAPRRYRVSVPPAARFSIDIDRKEANGVARSGSGEMVWWTDGARYTVKLEAGISLLVTRLNLLSSTSEGGIDDAGIAPLTFTEKRVSRSMTATHFGRDGGEISFSASERRVPLAPGAQDKASLLFQLAGIARAGPEQLSGPIDVQVGEDRDAAVYSFVLVGQETLDTPLGQLATWHLARPPRPGTYNSRLDVWLAPSQDWYPVRIRNTEASGAVTTQTVTRIERNQAGNT